MPNFRFSVHTNPRIRDLSEMLKLDARDMRTMLVRVDTKFIEHEAQLFATEGGAAGARWPPLSPAYRAWKAKRYPGRKIMQRKGDLRHSLTVKGHPEHVSQYSLNPGHAQLQVGTGDTKAAWHGDSVFHNRRLPVRDVIAHTPQQLGRYGEIVQDYLGEKLDRVRRVLLAWTAVSRRGAA